MRVWDLPPVELCRVHLLGEHRELHAVWTILTQDKKGYRNHPETKRWVGKLRALYDRHELLKLEMAERSYRHLSDLDSKLAVGKSVQNEYINTFEEQKELLRVKNCNCFKSE